ncbi:DUF2786 domain-containing protein [Corynebacterium comes]|uniref:DUF2786 domain-containing protein n=1 Tax=Corynebacterium comes TaxID=2675218 RepID=A0A6B8VPV3_9CORY|nr:DUF2786 domain-containing protein [Corynebacterium comes]QGU05079.1 hypothetical protein CETAM_09125 [Corynebacterium comes]
MTASTLPASTDPERVHREELQWTIVDRILAAARLGWAPDDIRHLVGSSVDPFLAVARPQVEAVAPDTVRAAWRRQCHSPDNRHTGECATGRMETIAEKLRDLPVFRDTELLTDLHLLRGRDLDPAGLSTDQRRAQQRITGLLKKAESTTFAAEAEALVAKAQQLRQRYRIDNVQSGHLSPEPGDVVSLRVRLTAPWVRQQFLLLSRVSFANSCRSILNRSVAIASLIGHADDVRHVAELFASLNHQRDYFMRTAPGAHEAARERQTLAYRRSFLFSYAIRIGDLLTAAAEEVALTPHEEKNILPVLAHRGVMSGAATDRLFPHTTGISFGHEHHASGAADGVRAAERSRLEPQGPAMENA